MTARAFPPGPGVATLRALPLLIVALLALRAGLAGLPGLWIDEAFSLYHARAPLARLWGEGWRLESSPPLYYTVLWAWIRVAGESETAARLLSVALTVVSTLLVRDAARTLAGPAAGRLAAACWLLPALAFEYALEIRPYALKSVFVAAATAAFARALLELRCGRIVDARGAARAIAPIVLAAAAAFYTHTTAFAVLVGLAVAAAFHGWRTRAGARFAIAWCAGGVALAVLCLPQLATALGVLDSNRAGLAWIPSPFDPRYASWVLRVLVLGQVVWPAALSVPLAAAVYAGLGAAAWRMRDRIEVLAVGLVFPVAGAAALWIAGISQPIVMGRTVLWVWVPLSVLCGCAASRVESRRLAAIGVAALALSGATLASWLAQRDTLRPWHAAIVALESRIRPGDRVLVLDAEVGCVLDRYAGPAVRAAPLARLRLPDHPPPATGQRIDLGCNALPEVGEADVAARAPSADWLLPGDPTQRGDVERILARGRERLRATDALGDGPGRSAVRVVATDPAGATRP